MACTPPRGRRICEKDKEDDTSQSSDGVDVFQDPSDLPLPPDQSATKGQQDILNDDDEPDDPTIIRKGRTVATFRKMMLKRIQTKAMTMMLKRIQTKAMTMMLKRIQTKAMTMMLKRIQTKAMTMMLKGIEDITLSKTADWKHSDRKTRMSYLTNWTYSSGIYKMSLRSCQTM